MSPCRSSQASTEAASRPLLPAAPPPFIAGRQRPHRGNDDQRRSQPSTGRGRSKGGSLSQHSPFASAPPPACFLDSLFPIDTAPHATKAAQRLRRQRGAVPRRALVPLPPRHGASRIAPDQRLVWVFSGLRRGLLCQGPCLALPVSAQGSQCLPALDSPSPPRRTPLARACAWLRASPPRLASGPCSGTRHA